MADDERYNSIAGHSMGGQASHRYAILKKMKSYDDNISYWVGNPG
jgi:S-formylglutathione hydrolase FrmB